MIRGALPLILVLGFVETALAQGSIGGTDLTNPVVLVIVLGALSLAPFVLIMLTSFVKISVVLSILRNALGTQSVPPNQVITGLAFVLTIFVMIPVGEQMYAAAGSVTQTRDIFSEASVRSIYEASAQGKEPLRQFLGKHSHNQDRLLFMELATRLDAQSPNPVRAGRDDFKVIIPAFVTSELKEAFQIGFLVFVPFI